MISLKINKALVTPLAAEALIKVCPFSAITYEDETLDIGAGCRMCKLCVKKGPEGVVSLVETHDELVDKSLWNGTSYCPLPYIGYGNVPALHHPTPIPFHPIKRTL